MMWLHSLVRLRETMQRRTGEGEDVPLPLLDHLEELRRTLLRMAAALLLAMLLCFFLTPWLMRLLSLPVEQVRMQQEADALPAAVSVQEWIEAKRLAEVLAALDEEARQLLTEQMPARRTMLARCVPLLRAAAELPEGQRRGFLAAATAAPGQEALRDTLLALHDSGALLRPAPGQDHVRLMGAFQPAEGFMLSLHLAFFGGLVLSFPVQLRLLLHFIIPGLRAGERRLLYRCVAWGCLLFAGGCAFAYLVVLPRVLSFFYGYTASMGIENEWRIGYYLSFAAKLVFMFGAVFELPVLVIPLIRLGILRYEMMRRTRAAALIACFAAALLLAPAPDPGTMILMALPMYLLYELCILFARRHARRVSVAPEN